MVVKSPLILMYISHGVTWQIRFYIIYTCPLIRAYTVYRIEQTFFYLQVANSLSKLRFEANLYVRYAAYGDNRLLAAFSIKQKQNALP